MATLQKWLGAIAAYEREFQAWENRAKKIVSRYTDKRSETASNPAKFNILWSNVQTLIPAVYARTPKPDVSRRFRDDDPVGRVASMIIERALEFEIDHYPDYRSALKNVVLDRFLGGRGTAWVRYEPHFRAAEIGTPEDGLQITEDADEAESDDPGPDGAAEEIDYECCPVDYVHWRDFGHTVARTWEEVTAVWRRVYMSRAGLVERFGEELGNEIPLDTRPDRDKTTSGPAGEDQQQAAIYEVWDKSTGKVFWLSKSVSTVLDERDDVLKLENFFPCPRPLFATLTTDGLVPTPDFVLYQDQARELDVLSERIDRLIDALQVKGIYDASVPELARLFTEAGNGELIPVKNWQSFSEKSGLKGSIDIVDIANIVNALNAAYRAVDVVKNHIYEIMGVADILRGASDANETLGAQRLKGQFGSLRLRSMQGDVVQFATELLHIKAQILCGQFQPQTLVEISAAGQLSPHDQPMIGPALQLLANSPLRNFRVEVSSDSMVQLDETQERADRMEFLKAVGGFLSQAMQLVKEAPTAAPLAVELLKFGVTGFKVGKGIEGAFDAAIDQLKQSATAPQSTAPSADAMKAQLAQQQMQMDAQLEQQKMQMDAQLEQQKMQATREREIAQMQADQAVHAARAQADIQVEQARIQATGQIEQIRAAAQQETDRQKMAYNMQLEQYKQQQKANVDVMLAHIKKDTAVEVAQINNATVMTPEQDAAANAEGAPIGPN